MPDITLKLWEFEKAPADLRRLFPCEFTGHWMVHICSDPPPDFVDDLIVHWKFSGLVVAQGQALDGGIVLVGTHPPQQPC